MIRMQMKKSMLHLSWRAWSSLARQTCDADRTADLAHTSLDLVMPHAVFLFCCLQMPRSIVHLHASHQRQLSSKMTLYILAYHGDISEAEYSIDI